MEAPHPELEQKTNNGQGLSFRLGLTRLQDVSFLFDLPCSPASAQAFVCMSGMHGSARSARIARNQGIDIQINWIPDDSRGGGQRFR